jgi:L-ribulokinase
MEEHGVPIKRVINAGGIPQKNNVLNQVYANVLGRPVLVPGKSVVSLGSAIFAFMAAGTFPTLEEAQDRLCPEYAVFTPMASEQAVYSKLYPVFRRMYFAFGDAARPGTGDVLPELIQIAESLRG